MSFFRDLNFLHTRTGSVLLVSVFFLNINVIHTQENLAQKLGYEKDAKLLIIHADDLGFSHSENKASIKAIEVGSVNSASIIMPGSWVEEIAEYAQENKNEHDLGIHLAITSEWKNFKWGPVASNNDVTSIINKHGYFYKDCPVDGVALEVEKELRAQIQLAYTMGIDPTHLDSHMGCLFWGRPEFFEIYIKLANEFGIPCLIDKSFASLFPDEQSFNDLLKKYEAMLIIDYNMTISTEEYAVGAEQYYKGVLKNLKPGLNQILIHPAYDNEEMRAITIDHPDWGTKWRQDDYDFFTSDTCKRLIEQEQIIMVTWREIKDALNK